jgi:type I restriction enzyme R subunit
MNEADTRANLIDPKLKACGWGVVEGSKILREQHAKITDGKIQTGGGRSKPMIADYILVYKGVKLAVVEYKLFNNTLFHNWSLRYLGLFSDSESLPAISFHILST